MLPSRNGITLRCSSWQQGHHTHHTGKLCTGSQDSASLLSYPGWSRKNLLPFLHPILLLCIPKAWNKCLWWNITHCAKTEEQKKALENIFEILREVRFSSGDGNLLDNYVEPCTQKDIRTGANSRNQELKMDLKYSHIRTDQGRENVQGNEVCPWGTCVFVRLHLKVNSSKSHP